jgi:hypothetical protein
LALSEPLGRIKPDGKIIRNHTREQTICIITLHRQIV